VTAPHFCAGAEWEKVDGQWNCVRAAPILAWMVGHAARGVGIYLTRKGWDYEWIDIGSESGPIEVLLEGKPGNGTQESSEET
jgi:hypothetical protein